jgi:hypothetical protein
MDDPFETKPHIPISAYALRLMNAILFVLFVILGVLPGLYVLDRLVFATPTSWYINGDSNQTLLDSVMSGLAATVFGIAIGVPVALWLSRRQQDALDYKEMRAQEREEVLRQTKVLDLIHGELEYNKDLIQEGQIDPENPQAKSRKVSSVAPPKNELWNAFSDGGEIQYIRDVSLLDAISTAYYSINIVISLEKKYTDGSLLVLGLQQRRSIQDTIMKDILIADVRALTDIQTAILAIHRRLVEIKKIQLLKEKYSLSE